MKNRTITNICSAIWIIALLFMIAVLWQLSGYARAINYAGIVRGGTQKLCKEELYGIANDDFIAHLDGIIYDLQTGEGEYGLLQIRDETFQTDLLELQDTWDILKQAIYDMRAGQGSAQTVYEISQQHFVQADEMVGSLEEKSTTDMNTFLIFFFFGLAFSIFVLAVYHSWNKKVLCETRAKDALTGLLSRIGFEEEAVKYRRQNVDQPLALIKFDIDQFKLFNNTYGYQNGDALLMQIAAALTNWATQASICARIDADEFVVLGHQADFLLEELEDVLQQSVASLEVSKYVADIKFTFGAYELVSAREQIKTVLDKANEAHENAKNDASRNVVWYNSELLEKLARDNKVVQRMRQSMECKEFQLYLQPIIDLNTLQPVGAEALVRLQWPDAALLYPDAFIPLLENKGLIAELDFYMLEQVCSYLHTLRARGVQEYKIAINISRVSLYKKTFYQDFIEVLIRYNIPCTWLEIEVLESALSEVDESVIAQLQRLKETGVRVAMDDFGAGYSNYNTLGYLPVDVLKLDKQFLQERRANPKMDDIMRYTVELAHVLGMKIVCEGVENAEDIPFLQQIGCEYAQGYYFARPCPCDALKVSPQA